MAKRPTRLRFTEDDLADSHVKKAADRADKAVDRAEKAADKLASKKAKPKLKLETDAAGSRKAKLRFEKAEFTEIERPSVAKHMASRGAAVTLTSKAHRAVSEYEDDNIGVQAVQETTKAVESTVYTVDHAVYSHKLKAYDKAMIMRWFCMMRKAIRSALGKRMEMAVLVLPYRTGIRTTRVIP